MQKQQTIQRIEKKYLLTPQEYAVLMSQIETHLIKDSYADSTIFNLYLDGDDFHMISTSMQKPIYKEKLRLRSYHAMTMQEDAMVFLEIKKKWKQVVCKRRLEIPLPRALQLIHGLDNDQTQIEQEIGYALRFHHANFKVFVAYDRKSWIGKENPSLRLTFDTHIRGRLQELSLQDTSDNKELFDDGCLLLEIKANRSYPLWLVQTLSAMKLYPTSFSKVAQIMRKEVASRGGALPCSQAY